MTTQRREESHRAPSGSGERPALAADTQPRAESEPPHAERTVVVASRHGTLTALRATDGQVVWRRVLGPRLGALAQDGERVYASISPPLPGRIREEPLPAEQRTQHQLGRRLRATPGWILALRASDGALLWMREGWRLPMHHGLALDGETLFADDPTEEVGSAVSALDARTGELRWSRAADDPWTGTLPRLVAAAGGCVYIEEWGSGIPGGQRRLRALDARTGAPLWRHTTGLEPLKLSERGTYALAAGAPGQGEGWPIRDAHDGTILTALPGAFSPLALSERGVVYVSMLERMHPTLRATLRALTIADRSECWRVEGFEAREVTLRGDALYYVDLPQPAGRAEVGALDLHTGRRLWRWRSPAHLVGLLRLWGRETPWVLVHAARQSRRAIADARAMHMRHVIWGELTRGQWRHPAALGEMSPLAVDEESVYLGTTMGLFALRATDGRLRWHALPTADLSPLAPAVPAKHGER